MGSLRRSLSTTAGAAATTTTNSPSSSSSTTSTGGGKQSQQQQRLIPTRHSSKAPPPVCRDAIELQELTQELLETPVGSLFCQSSKGIVKTSASPRDDRDEAYATARESGELVEYLLRGYNATISPLTLYGGGTIIDKSAAGTATSVDPDQVSASLETMMDVTERFHQEGQMYLQLRKEGLDYKNAANPTDSSSSSSDSDSDSDSDDLLDDLDKDGTNDPRFSSAVGDKLKVDARDKKKQQKQLGSGADDFAMPGVTTAMYDTILDAMACAAQLSLEAAGSQQSTTTTASSSYLQLLEPDDLYRVTGAAWNAHELNNQHNNDNDLFFPSTTPSMVTYNATLRGIGNLCLAASASSGNDDDDDNRRRMVVDQGLAYGFGVYNNLTHNDHGLPKRNSASVVYLLNVIRACIPPSRTRGNMTVALWHQASMEGLVTAELIRTLKDLHVESNGPEFDVFLESLDQCTAQKNDDSSSSSKVVITPQRFARFAKKYSHSKHY